MIELLATGTPMLLMGDEMRHTQRGNNNAYSRTTSSTGSTGRSSTSMPTSIDSSRRLPASASGATRGRGRGVDPEPAAGAVDGWPGTESCSIGRTGARIRIRLRSRLPAQRAGCLVHVMFNAFWEPLEFQLPVGRRPEGRGWRRCIDTAAPPPHDAVPLMAGAWACVGQLRRAAAVAGAAGGAAAGRPGRRLEQRNLLTAPW